VLSFTQAVRRAPRACLTAESFSALQEELISHSKFLEKNHRQESRELREKCLDLLDQAARLRKSLQDNKRIWAQVQQLAQLEAQIEADFMRTLGEAQDQVSVSDFEPDISVVSASSQISTKVCSALQKFWEKKEIRNGMNSRLLQG
jgi:hypothetical protein